MAFSGKAKDEVLRFIRSKLVAVVASVCPDGTPEAATMFYWVNDVDENGFGLYFLTRRQTRKVQNILANPAVAVVVGTEFAPETVQMNGVASVVEAADAMEGMRELHELLRKHPVQSALYAAAFFPKNPFGAIEGEDFVLIKFRPSWIRHMTVDKKAKVAEYTQIIP